MSHGCCCKWILSQLCWRFRGLSLEIRNIQLMLPVKSAPWAASLFRGVRGSCSALCFPLELGLCTRCCSAPEETIQGSWVSCCSKYVEQTEGTEAAEARKKKSFAGVQSKNMRHAVDGVPRSLGQSCPQSLALLLFPEEAKAVPPGCAGARLLQDPALDVPRGFGESRL